MIKLGFILVYFVCQFGRRMSLPPPDPPRVTWEEYIDAPPGQNPVLGRPHICKESQKNFKATIAMVSEVHI